MDKNTSNLYVTNGKDEGGIRIPPPPFIEIKYFLGKIGIDAQKFLHCVLLYRL